MKNFIETKVKEESAIIRIDNKRGNLNPKSNLMYQYPRVRENRRLTIFTIFRKLIITIKLLQLNRYLKI